MAARTQNAALANLRASDRVETSLLDDPQIENAVLTVTDLSPAFARLLLSDPKALQVLSDLAVRERTPEESDALVGWSKRELLRIACRDLLGLDDVSATGSQLSDLAIDVIDRAVIATPDAQDLIVIGMGKLGARELNYASDIDLMFSGEAPESAARRVSDIARTCFRVDTNLRPEGRSGPLVRSVESFSTYWEQWASPWEFQALLKASVIAGSTEIARQWTAAASEALWSRMLSADDLAYLRSMKRRSEQLANPTGRGIEVKRSVGGIRDIEFSVQLLQLVHGSADSSIREPSTLAALKALSAGGYVDASDAGDLSESYELLRNIEHRVQLVELQQTHTVPDDIGRRRMIAKSLYMDLNDFDQKLRSCRSMVRRGFERLYFRPLLEAFAGPTRLTEGDVKARLSALGFSDATRTRLAVEELTEGLNRSSKLMSQLMPLLLDWLSESPDPDMGLLGLRRLLSSKRAPTHALAAFRDSPEVARRVCLVLGTSPLFERALSRHPELFDVINERHNDNTDIAEQVRFALDWRSDALAKRSTIARINDLHRNRIAMNEVLGLMPHETACVVRSSLADAVLTHIAEQLAPDARIAVIALGRYGGEELGPGSDLDVMVIHDVDGSAGERFAHQLLANINHPSPGFQLYELDYSLRPEGKQGPVARSLTSCAEYYSRWAQAWERQAMLRARWVCGDPDLGRDFFQMLENFIWAQPFAAEDAREIRHLKARMEKERIPKGEDRRFHLKLGNGTLSDAEWTIQLLQLQNGVRSNNTMSALRQLMNQELLSPRDAQALEEAWRFCGEVRDRASLIAGRPVGALPTDRERLSVLARSLDTNAADLQSTYLRLTRRCREVTERLFYQADSL